MNEGATDAHSKTHTKYIQCSVVNHLILIISSLFRTVWSAEIIPFCFHQHVLHFIAERVMLALIEKSPKQFSFKARWADNCLFLFYQIFWVMQAADSTVFFVFFQDRQAFCSRMCSTFLCIWNLCPIFKKKKKLIWIVMLQVNWWVLEVLAGGFC